MPRQAPRAAPPTRNESARGDPLDTAARLGKLPTDCGFELIEAR